MYEANDVKRSIRKYLAALLDESWTVRIERREVRDEDRPVAVIELGQESIVRAREALTQGEVETAFPVTVSCYPPLPPEAEPTADPPPDPIREAEAIAEGVKTLLVRWLMFGLTVRTEPTKGTKRNWAGPYRIPLYDFADTPLTGPNRELKDPPHDVLWVASENVSAEAIQDAEDLRRWSVVLDFRVTMEQPGRVPLADEGYVAEKLSGGFVPPPGHVEP